MSLPQFSLNTYPRGGTFVVALAGVVDYLRAEVLNIAVDAALEDGERIIVVDLSDATFVDSVILSRLRHWHEALSFVGGTLHVVVRGANVRRVFEITGDDAELNLHETFSAIVTSSA